MKYEDAKQINKNNWNNRAKIHIKDVDGFYRIPEFLEGQCSLRPLERVEFTNVKDKNILHLMCHIGLDSISLAAKGAKNYCNGPI